MSLKITKNLQFLTEIDYWRYGPCFEVCFYFKDQRCSLSSFEKLLLADPMVLALPELPFESGSDSDRPGRCVLLTGGGESPLGFIYWGRDLGDYDLYYLATYPRQMDRHCGDFNWYGKADNPQSVISLYSELLTFVRRLHTQLDFHLALMRDEGAPYFTSPHSSLNGILIYDWLAREGDFAYSDLVEHCYALLPFE
jgi:hypothetical protein